MPMRKDKIGIIGLGYVGFPLACLMAKAHDVVGFDLKQKRVEALLSGYDATDEVAPDEVKHALERGLTLTSDPELMKDCNIYIVTVPTPVDCCHKPDLRPLKKASKQVGSWLKHGDIVIYESTVYPGVTEDTCVPILAKESGLKYNIDFFAGYSPERVNPGDREHTVETIVKITSGSTPEVAKRIDDLYNSVLLNGTYPARSIKVAEAAKIIENTQRDVNIAFMNETAMIFRSMGIDIEDVIKAASSKWNFLPFRPGLVGGHCIGVDPYYLIHRAELGGIKPRLISEARNINDNMGHYMAKQILDYMLAHDLSSLKAKVLIAGFTFKPNCPDTRNTKVIDVYRTLKNYIPEVDIYDPLAIADDVKEEYGLGIITDINQLEAGAYDVIALSVPHTVFESVDWNQYLTPVGFIFNLFPPQPKDEKKMQSLMRGMYTKASWLEAEG